MDYDYGPKRNWRRWIYNRAVEHLESLSIRPRDAVVLYLAGEQNFDREIALSKGFLGHNLIAVERDRLAIQKIKDSGTLCVSGELSKVLMDCTIETSLIVADFCSPICGEVLSCLVNLVNNPRFKKCILAINLLRGRECLPEDWQESIRGKHRGQAAFGIMFHLCLACFHRCGCVRISGNNAINLDWHGSAEAKRLSAAFGLPIEDYCKKRELGLASFFWGTPRGIVPSEHPGYLSTSGQMFDSCVGRIPSVSTALEAVGGKCEYPTSVTSKEGRSLVAIRAVRTRLQKA